MAERNAALLYRKTITSVEQLAEPAKFLASLLELGDLLVLTGELGAGKTTFTRSLAKELGVVEAVSSPTFVLARSYELPNLLPNQQGTLIHLDAYRISSAEELADLALPYSSSITLAEWGAGLVESEFDSWLELKIERQKGFSQSELSGSDFSAEDQQPRLFELYGYGEKWLRLAEELAEQPAIEEPKAESKSALPDQESGFAEPQGGLLDQQSGFPRPQKSAEEAK